MTLHFSRLLLSWLICLLFGSQAFPQDRGPYHLSFQRELLYGGGGVGLTALGAYLRNQTPDLVLSDLVLEDINGFDRVATRMSSDLAARWSDYLLNGSLVLPAVLLTKAETRRDFGKIMIMYSETVLINHGLTDIIKSTFLRPRPYVFDENLPPETVLNDNDRAAFLSGHTSATASSCYFTAQVFSDYFPDSRLRPYVWAAAISIPALTAYLRVRAGRHYPSDVIAGYILGAGVGYLIPTLHRRPLSRLTILPAAGGLYLSYRF